MSCFCKWSGNIHKNFKFMSVFLIRYEYIAPAISPAIRITLHRPQSAMSPLCAIWKLGHLSRCWSCYPNSYIRKKVTSEGAKRRPVTGLSIGLGHACLKKHYKRSNGIVDQIVNPSAFYNLFLIVKICWLAPWFLPFSWRGVFTSNSCVSVLIFVLLTVFMPHESLKCYVWRFVLKYTKRRFLKCNRSLTYKCWIWSILFL